MDIILMSESCNCLVLYKKGYKSEVNYKFISRISIITEIFQSKILDLLILY